MLASKREREKEREIQIYNAPESTHIYSFWETWRAKETRRWKTWTGPGVSACFGRRGPRVYCELTCARVYVSMFLHVSVFWKLLCVFIYIYVFACFWMFAGIMAILDFSLLQWNIGKLGIAATQVIIFHRVSCRDFSRNCQQVRLELSCSSIPRKTAGCCNLTVN